MKYNPMDIYDKPITPDTFLKKIIATFFVFSGLTYDDEQLGVVDYCGFIFTRLARIFIHNAWKNYQNGEGSFVFGIQAFAIIAAIFVIDYPIRITLSILLTISVSPLIFLFHLPALVTPLFIQSKVNEIQKNQPLAIEHDATIKNNSLKSVSDKASDTSSYGRPTLMGMQTKEQARTTNKHFINPVRPDNRFFSCTKIDDDLIDTRNDVATPRGYQV